MKAVLTAISCDVALAEIYILNPKKKNTKDANKALYRKNKSQGTSILVSRAQITEPNKAIKTGVYMMKNLPISFPQK